MKKGFVLLLIFVAQTIFISTLVQAEPPAAILLSCRGDVIVIKSSGETVKGTFGLSLEEGDEIRTGKDSEAEIHFENGSWVHIGAGSSMHVKGSRMTKPAPGIKEDEKSFERVRNFLKLKGSEGTSTLAMLRSVEKSTDLKVKSPCQSKIREAHPKFHWDVSDSSTELRLTVYNEEGILWKKKVKGITSLPYPSDAPDLAPGTTYSWTLETTDPLQFPPLRSQAAFFEILTPEEVAQLKTELSQITREKIASKSAYHLARASLFFGYGLLEEAIHETKQALDADPENATLHSILARLYSQAGRTKEALGEYNQLLEQR